MVKVHIWTKNSTHVGHAALTIGSTYISFWPDGEAGKKDLKIKTSQPGSFMTNLATDIKNEGNRQPITVTLNDLEEKEILLFIRGIQLNIPRYQLARNNCSHIVAQCLQAGAKKPSFTPSAKEYGKLGSILGYGIWTPEQVLRYARELA
ncbi:hypothetical protein [Colwellia psychrerythraea]|uniref:DUF4105 domain-containing protein n=1 Tax=Colwellia psychrerythraea TaxID=28229 RepID=A0A099L1D7_COLPS|nr:hypothetical protein [Colwellia psychrerythraea]KGJ96636.1 hypothetical protein GAB14E_1710 [Colwellia psychrerythraea]